MDLSVVIVNWNAKEFLEECLGSVLGNRSSLAIEVILVDNNSGDGSVEMVKDRFPGVVCIENKFNAGFGAANNQGIRMCKSDNILLLNPDTRVLPDALTALVALARSRSDAGAVGPRILNPDGSLQYECARNAPTPISEFFVATTLYKRFPRSRVFGRYLMTYWDHDDEREVEAISGACALLRKRALCDSGLFDEDFFMYAEDTDLFCRIREKGWKVYFTPKAEIIHYWGKSAEQVPYPMAIEAKRSMERYFMKHGGLPSVIAHRLLTLVASLSMIAACFIMYMNIFGTKRSNLSFIMKRYLYITGWSIGVK